MTATVFVGVSFDGFAVLHVYERAGGLRYGEVEVGQETVIFDPDPAVP